MRSFSELLQEYTTRTGISDAELARAIGVRRQTVFRWKEGTVARPRNREDVLALRQKLRLTPQEGDELLVAAGFHPEGPPPTPRPTPQELAASQGTDAPEPTAHLRATLPTSFHQLTGAAEDDRLPEAATPPPSARLRPFWLGLSGLLVAGLLVALWWSRQQPLPQAIPGQTLVLIGQFANYTGGEIGFNVAGRIADPLREEIAGANLPEVAIAVWPTVIRSEAEARSALLRARGWMIIWGEYDSGRVLVRFTQTDVGQSPPPIESLIASPGELFATINSALPQEVRYLALLTLGSYYAESNDYAQARLVLERAAAAPPSQRDAQVALLLRLGLAYQMGNDPLPDRAIAVYDDLLALAPDHLLAAYNRGLAYLARNRPGDIALALADFGSVISSSPTFLAARIGRGVALLYRRQPDDDEAALVDFSYVIERDSERPMAYYNRGLLAIRLDRRRLWEKDLHEVIELAPAFAGGYSALCWGYALVDEIELALPVCEQALALGAQEALHSRAIAYARAGDYTEAVRDLQGFLAWLDQQGPTSPYALYRSEVGAWIAALSTGDNPISDAILARLRVE